jgi:hypothetical protein
MSGRVVSTRTVTLQPGRARVSIPLGAAERERLARDGSALISFETPGDEVQALDIALGRR